MRREAQSISIYRQFLYSFLAVLVLPVIVFSTVFFYFNQRNYQDKTVASMDASMRSSVDILDDNLANLNATMFYHSNMRYLQDKVVQKDIIGRDISVALASEAATNSFLDGLCYYNELMAKRVYTENGTYELEYYAERYLHMTRSEFLETVSGIRNCGWISVQEEKDGSMETARLYYVLRGLGKEDYWLFKISKSSLHQIIFADDVEVRLLDSMGNTIYSDINYPENVPGDDDIIELKKDSEHGTYSIVKRINREKLSREMHFWQNCFFVMILAVTLAGILVVVKLTNYQIRPIYELHDYCAQKSLSIPEETKGFGTYLYVIKDLDMQIEMLNELKKKERLLLQIFYDINGKERDLQEKIKAAGLFADADCFRVIIVQYPNGTGKKLELYSQIKAMEGYEAHAIDTLQENASIIIVGMKASHSDALEERLNTLVKKNRGDRESVFWIYVGEQVECVSRIRQSYLQAMLCGKDSLTENETDIRFFRQQETEKEPTPDQGLIEKVCRYIDENISLYDLNVNFVAEKFEVSNSNLSHQFKRQMNQTLQDYISSKKFSYAAELLRDTDYSVQTIATMLGYSQPSSFIKKFGTLYGMTPVNYRNASREKKEI